MPIHSTDAWTNFPVGLAIWGLPGKLAGCAAKMAGLPWRYLRLRRRALMANAARPKISPADVDVGLEDDLPITAQLQPDALAAAMPPASGAATVPEIPPAALPPVAAPIEPPVSTVPESLIPEVPPIEIAASGVEAALLPAVAPAAPVDPPVPALASAFPVSWLLSVAPPVPAPPCPPRLDALPPFPPPTEPPVALDPPLRVEPAMVAEPPVAGEPPLLVDPPLTPPEPEEPPVAVVPPLTPPEPVAPPELVEPPVAVDPPAPEEPPTAVKYPLDPRPVTSLMTVPCRMTVPAVPGMLALADQVLRSELVMVWHGTPPDCGSTYIRYCPLSNWTMAGPSSPDPHPAQSFLPTKVQGPVRLGAVACSRYRVVSLLMKA